MPLPIPALSSMTTLCLSRAAWTRPGSSVENVLHCRVHSDHVINHLLRAFSS